MGLISGVLSFILCGIVYVRMVKREVPEPMSWKGTVVSVILGLIAPFLVVLVVALLGLLVRAITGGRSIAEAVSSRLVRSLLSSFLGAGFTEEFVKCLLILLVVRIARPRNVYEYILIGAGVGFGFTLMEEIQYGSTGGVSSLPRLITFALHMLFGMIMASYFGRARYNREHGLDGSGKLIFLGCFLPVLWHTLYDAATATNAALNSEEDMELLLGVAVAIVMFVGSGIYQFVLLKKFKNKTEEYCAMEFEDTSEPAKQM